MAVNQTVQSLAVKQNWVKSGDSYVGDYPNGGAPISGGGTEILSYDFSDGLIPSGDEWFSGTNTGGTLAVVNNVLQGQYVQDAQDVAVFVSIDVDALNLQQVYIEFDARMPSVGKAGCKFVKLSGRNNAPTGSASCTFGLQYSTGAMNQFSFGDGTTTSNDTQNVINLDGSSPSLIGRSFGNGASVSTPNGAWADTDWGTDWHHFKLMFKHNSGTTLGTETNDGEVYIEIDGQVYVNASGLFTRNYQNSLYFDKIKLFDVAQGTHDAFTLEYDNIVISSGGFI